MIAILGGGLSGLQLGRKLAERGEDFVILEDKAQAGGLCRTVARADGHSFDLGPHAFYSKKPQALRYYEELPLDWARCERKVRVCHREGAGVFEVGYPFENGLHDLPWSARLECVAGYCKAAWAGGGPPYASLPDWIERGLGEGISRHFMRPYNLKIWSCPLEQVSMDLVSQKIEPEKPLSVLRQSLLGGGVGRAYQAKFVYPRGGAGAMTDEVAKAAGSRLRKGRGVRKLERRAGGWRVVCEGGAEVSADRVVSTIPIPELLDALGDTELSALRPAFRWNDTVFVVVGLRAGRRFSRFDDCQWVFFAGGEQFYRITMMHAFGHERPATMVAEVTVREGLPADAALVSRTLSDLREAGLLESEADVECAFTHRERYTYPIPTLGMKEARGRLEQALEARGLHLLGRMGRWDYMNTDGVFLAVDALLPRLGAAVAS